MDCLLGFTKVIFSKAVENTAAFLQDLESLNTLALAYTYLYCLNSLLFKWSRS